MSLFGPRNFSNNIDEMVYVLLSVNEGLVNVIGVYNKRPEISKPNQQIFGPFPITRYLDIPVYKKPELSKIYEETNNFPFDIFP